MAPSEIYIFEKNDAIFLTHQRNHEGEIIHFCFTDLKETVKLNDIYQGRVKRIEGSRAWIDIGFSKLALLNAPGKMLEEGELICVSICRPPIFSELGLKGPQVTHRSMKLAKNSQKIGFLQAGDPEWFSYINSLKTPVKIFTNKENIFHILKKSSPLHHVTLKSDMEIPSNIVIGWQTLLEPLVEIPGGGSIFFEERETLTTIDINTTTQGEWLSPDFKDDYTWVKFNLKAAQIIQTQVQLRQIGGMIIVDFPSVFNKLQAQTIFKEMKNLSDEYCNVYGFTRGGLFEMARRKFQSSLPRRLKIFKEKLNNGSFF